ncbi:MAG: glutathione S-transferase N-terminal domain-containing protein [Bacteriovoracaceae bacterium]
MDLEFYFLMGSKNRIISPQCFRVKMALHHLLVNFQEVGVSLSDKEAFLKKMDSTDLPLIIDGKWIVQGSWNIACFLERNYVQQPTLLGGELGKAHLKFIQNWVDGILVPNIFVFIIKDIYDSLPANDKEIFQTTEEKRYGMSLEQVQNENRVNIDIFRNFLHPLRVTLQHQPFFSGESPAYADYLIFSSFKWAAMNSSFPLLEEVDIIYGWFCELNQFYEQGLFKPNLRKSS